MKEEYQEHLCKTYPKLYNTRVTPHNTTCQEFGFSVGDGWFTIIDGLSQCMQDYINSTTHARWRARKRIRELQADPKADLSTEVVMPKRVLQVNVLQVKEKFGTLRFYVRGGNDVVYNFIQLAETMSGVACEDCGAPGKRIGKGWIRTLCPACNEKVKQKGKP